MPTQFYVTGHPQSHFASTVHHPGSSNEVKIKKPKPVPPLQGVAADERDEIRVRARKLFDEPYWRKVKERLSLGTLAPQLEARLLAYSYGEPSTSGLAVTVGALVQIVDELHVTTRVSDSSGGRYPSLT